MTEGIIFQTEDIIFQIDCAVKKLESAQEIVGEIERYYADQWDKSVDKRLDAERIVGEDNEIFKKCQQEEEKNHTIFKVFDLCYDDIRKTISRLNKCKKKVSINDEA